ncbi:MAG: hypothetical protein ACI9MC_001444 [Kiritimatiellia bacterium]|jgi:hypothetical protein
MRTLLPLLTLLLTATASPSFAKGDGEKAPEGVALVVVVQDALTALPVPFARVREATEKSMHPVNRENGQFATTALYPDYSGEVPLRRGMELVLEVTAAGYEPAKITYLMRARKNKIVVQLQKMEIQPVIGPEPIFQFARDRPIGGRTLSPEELEKIEIDADESRKERE